MRLKLICEFAIAKLRTSEKKSELNSKVALGDLCLHEPRNNKMSTGAFLRQCGETRLTGNGGVVELWKYTLARSGLLAHTIDDAVLHFGQASTAYWGSRWETRGQSWLERPWRLSLELLVARCRKEPPVTIEELVELAKQTIVACQQLDRLLLATFALYFCTQANAARWLTSRQVTRPS